MTRLRRLCEKNYTLRTFFKPCCVHYRSKFTLLVKICSNTKCTAPSNYLSSNQKIKII